MRRGGEGGPDPGQTHLGRSVPVLAGIRYGGKDVCAVAIVTPPARA